VQWILCRQVKKEMTSRAQGTLLRSHSANLLIFPIMSTKKRPRFFFFFGGGMQRSTAACLLVVELGTHIKVMVSVDVVHVLDLKWRSPVFLVWVFCPCCLVLVFHSRSFVCVLRLKYVHQTCVASEVSPLSGEPCQTVPLFGVLAQKRYSGVLLLL
jgi:hypothetical protein